MDTLCIGARYKSVKEKIKHYKLFSFYKYCFMISFFYYNYCDFSFTFNATVKLTIRTDVGVEEENR